jgi:hypothetical protein
MADLAEAADLATRTGLASTDLQLLLALRRASDRFRGAVGHPVTEVTETVTVNGDGSSVLLLPAAAVSVVTEVKVLGTVVTDWEISVDGRLRRTGGVWPNTYGGVSVTYTHGYTPVPADIQDAVLEAAEADLSAQPGVQSMAVGGESVTYHRAGATQSWVAAVERYRIGRDRP